MMPLDLSHDAVKSTIEEAILGVRAGALHLKAKADEASAEALQKELGTPLFQ